MIPLIGAEGENRTLKISVLSGACLPSCITSAFMEPSIGRAPISAVYETAESLSILRGHHWSGWQDLNLRCLASEARGVTVLSYTQNHGAGHENCTRTNWLEASDAAVEH